MFRYIILFGIIALNSFGFSFADFQSELDKCVQITETQIPGGGAYTNKYDECSSKVMKKYTLTKTSVCKLKDGLYTNHDYMIKLSWPKRTAESREFYKYKNTIYYVVHTFTNDGQSSDYLYSYGCKSKKTLDMGIYFKNSSEFGRIIAIKAVKEHVLLLDGFMVPRGTYALFDSKKMELDPIKPNNLKNFSQLNNQLKTLLAKYFQGKGYSIPKGMNSLEQYAESILKNLDWSPISKESHSMKNIITTYDFDKNGVARISFNKGQTAFATSEEFANVSLGIVDFFNKIYTSY